MTERLDEKQTIIAASENPLSVLTGHGLRGFGGVAVYNPQDNLPKTLSLYPHENPEYTFGVAFKYRSTAKVHVNGYPKWTNYDLPGAPEGRQDILETGSLRIELFDDEELQYFLRENREALKRLGLNFIR